MASRRIDFRLVGDAADLGDALERSRWEFVKEGVRRCFRRMGVL